MTDEPLEIEGEDNWTITVLKQDVPESLHGEYFGLTSVAFIIENEAQGVGETIYVDAQHAEEVGRKIQQIAREAMGGG